MPAYFGKVYPEYSDQYSILNAFVVSIGGFASSLIGGKISDYYENRNFMTKAYVCM